MTLTCIRTRVLSLLCALTLLIAATDNANAQDPRRGYNNGVAAQGTDMWTQAMSGLRLFTPHRDNCNATTEAFVKVYTDSMSVDFGYCIDKDEHSAGAVNWEDARHECLDDGKRLPEPGEWKYACDQAGTLGLNNMTNSAEWASNFWQTIRKPNSDYWRATLAPVFGNGSCHNGDHGFIGITTSTASNTAFRCVR
jgi:hypothetical protein